MLKNLIYKDFRLVITMPIYLLVALFIALPLIPTYPETVTFIYIIVFYPIIFLGANKGTQNNDVYFSSTLPVTRKQIINARMATISIVQIVMMLLTAITIPIGYLIEQNFIVPNAPEGTIPIVGLGFEGLLALYGFVLISFSILDLIFIPLFYRTGKSFGVPFTIASFVYGVILATLTIALPAGMPQFYQLFGNWNTAIQLSTFFVCFIIYVILRFLTSFLAQKSFEKVDL